MSQPTTVTTNDVDKPDKSIIDLVKEEGNGGRKRRENEERNVLDEMSSTTPTRTRVNEPKRNGDRYGGMETERSGSHSGVGVRRCMQRNDVDYQNGMDEIQVENSIASRNEASRRDIAGCRMVHEAVDINDVRGQAVTVLTA